MTKKKKITLGILFAALFLISASAAYLWSLYRGIYVGEKTIVVGTPVPNASPTPTPDPLGPKNILLLGYGGAEHDGSLLTDTIIVAHVVPREKSVTLITIPRDTWVELPVTENSYKSFKVNHAYAIGSDDDDYPNKPDFYKGRSGGGNMAKYAIGQITGLNIDHFVSINFSSFRSVIDNIGGVTVNVPFTFTDNFYPIKGEEENICGKSPDEMVAIHATLSGELLEREFKCRFETVHYEKGLVTMTGDEALKFVRSRHSITGGSDFGRSQRQLALITAVKNKLVNYKSIPKIISIVNLASKNVSTDINISSALDLYRDNEIEDIEITSFSLTTDNVLKESTSSDRQYILIPKNNWESVHEFIKEKLSTN